MEKKSMIETAYEILKNSKTSLEFNKLWNAVTKELEFSEKQKEENISVFYTRLILDGRFVFLSNNFWDLKENQKLEDTHIRMNQAYTEEEDDEFEESDEDDELSEEKDDDEDDDEDEEEVYYQEEPKES